MKLAKINSISMQVILCMALLVLVGCNSQSAKLTTAGDFDCNSKIPTSTLEVPTRDFAPVGRNLPSRDGKYIALERGNRAHQCWQLDIWACDGSGTVFEGYRGVCAQGDNVGYRPVSWEEDGRLLVYFIPTVGPPPLEGAGQYLFDPRSKEWTKIGELTLELWHSVSTH